MAQTECDVDASCLEGFCVFDPVPRMALQSSHEVARVGEIVTLDGTASFLPGGGGLELELRVDPADGVEPIPGEAGEGVFSFRITRPRANLFVTLEGRTASGRTASASVAISPQNSPPTIVLQMERKKVQAGESVGLIAEVRDADWDSVEVEWLLEEGPGTLSPSGPNAILELSQDEPDAWYRVRATASDPHGGISTASLFFQAENLPPTIRSLKFPPPVEHECGESGCRANTSVEVVANDVGPMTYEWTFRGSVDGQGRVHVEAPSAPKAFILVESFLDQKMSGTYRIEVQVRDASGAMSMAEGEVVVGNRPPNVRAHDESVLHHAYLGPDQYRWSRSPGTFDFWEDPDGDLFLPSSVKWSSPDPSVTFLGPSNIDPTIRIEGGSELLGKCLPVEVIASDVNGAEASGAACLPLGNRLPVISVQGGGKAIIVLEGGAYRQAIKVDVSDPDGDPLTTVVAFDPTKPSPANMSLGHAASGWFLEAGSSITEATVGIYVEATDSLGGKSKSTTEVLYFR